MSSPSPFLDQTGVVHFENKQYMNMYILDGHLPSYYTLCLKHVRGSAVTHKHTLRVINV